MAPNCISKENDMTKKKKKGLSRNSWKGYRKCNSKQRRANKSSMEVFDQLAIKFVLKISVRITGFEKSSREE